MRSLIVKSWHLAGICLFLLSFENVWAIRDPHEPLPNRHSAQSESFKATPQHRSVKPAPGSHYIKPEKKFSPAPHALVRDVRHLSMLPSSLPENPKTENEISTALLNQLSKSPQWLDGINTSQLKLDYVRI